MGGAAEGVRRPVLAEAVVWLRGAQVSHLAARVLLELAQHMGGSGECWPSVARLCEHVGAGRRSVQRALAELLEHPAPPIARAIRGHHSSALYRVTANLSQGCHERRALGGAPAKTRQKRTGGVSPVARRGATGGALLVELPQGPPQELPAGPPDPGWSRQAIEDWTSRFPGSIAPGGRIGQALKPLVKAHTWARVRPAWQAYLRQASAQFASASRFSATWSEWAEQDELKVFDSFVRAGLA